MANGAWEIDRDLTRALINALVEGVERYVCISTTFSIIKRWANKNRTSRIKRCTAERRNWNRLNTATDRGRQWRRATRLVTRTPKLTFKTLQTYGESVVIAWKKKIKQSYQTTYSCKDYRGFLRNTSKLTLKGTTLPFTHRASVICALPLTHEIMFYWEIHTELQYLCKRGERLLD